MLLKYDLKLAGTETLPFLSNLFSCVDRNMFFYVSGALQEIKI